MRRALTGSLAKLSPETWRGFARHGRWKNIGGNPFKVSHKCVIPQTCKIECNRDGTSSRSMGRGVDFALNNESMNTCNIMQCIAAFRSLAGTRHQENESAGAFDLWEFLKMKKSAQQDSRFLFLTSEAATLQVTPVYRYTSTLNSIWVRPFDDLRLRHESW